VSETAAGAINDAPPQLSAADQVMRRLLLIPEQPTRVRERDVQRMFSTGILLSALRCLLSYIVLPLLGPILGVAGGVGPAIGLPLALVALYFDVLGIRRFFVANHRSRWQFALIYAAVMGLVLALMAIDIADLVH
jgi:hypothetical protein